LEHRFSNTNRIEHVADYFPYGKMLREFVDSYEEKYLTTQHERDVETGLDYRGARYYDADLGRFLSTDPLAKDFAAWSPYNYVMANPVIFVDPDGKKPLHADYLLTVGIKIFCYSLFQEGTSVEGALTVMAQAVGESGWDGSTTNYNLFGIMADRGEASAGSTAHGAVKDYTNDGKYEGSIQDYFDRLRERWPEMINVLQQETIGYDDIDRGLNTGTHFPTLEERHAGNYAYNADMNDEDENHYGEYLVGLRNSVRTRFIDALDYAITDASNTADQINQALINFSPNSVSPATQAIRMNLKIQLKEARVNERFYKSIKSQVETTTP